jgi:2-oxoglutarate dehydrogenase E2 component (dihydrolipoamide succinyltransferase)
MKAEIKVPTMGESISEATVGQILKPTGSAVKADEEILELETDKVNQVLYAPKAGVVTFSVGVDDTVTIGQVIGHVDTEGAAAEAPVAEKSASAPEPEAAPAAPASVPESQASVGEATRKGNFELVRELQNPPSAAAAPTATPTAPAKASGDRSETRRRMTKIRRVIAKKLVEAQQNAAMLTTFNEVDMTQILELRKTYKDAFEKQHGVRLGFMSFFVKAIVSALKEWPDINSYIDGDEIVHREYYDIGVAVGTERGLLVPVLRDCDQLSLAGIEKTIREYAIAARDGNLSVDTLQGGGFTVTNGGVYGSLLSTPILNPPQSGILGMHAIKERPMAVKGHVVIRPMMYLALSYDHRIVDGQGAVSFLVHLKNTLENLGSLALEI